MAQSRMLIASFAALALIGLSGCDGSESSPTATTDAKTEAAALVERFMQTRQRGLPADKFLSAEAQRAYEDHVGGLWLYDDTLPGGPGGEYKRFSVAEGEPGSFEVRIQVEWYGDAEPSEIVENLTVSSGKVVAVARTDDLADDGLPLAVAKTRERIYHAAVAHDYETLRSLVDPATFRYSLGEEGDPIGYWRRQERSEVPIVGDILPHLIHTRFGKHLDIYWWPSATSKLPADWTEADIESMRDAGYRDRDIRAFEEAIGGYGGWRAGIRADGTWLAFISGE
jgi:hypothetical protein